jgi:hypothetical protein
LIESGKVEELADRQQIDGLKEGTEGHGRGLHQSAGSATGGSGSV